MALNPDLHIDPTLCRDPDLGFKKSYRDSGLLDPTLGDLARLYVQRSSGSGCYNWLRVFLRAENRTHPLHRLVGLLKMREAHYKVRQMMPFRRVAMRS